VVQLDETGSIVRFAEKPPRQEVFSNLANAGIYVMEPEILARIPPGQVYDFGHDLFPKMLAEAVPMAGHVIEDIVIDIGLPEKYEEANQIVLAATANSKGN
jgi:mannose-1-phosphate guanylyltransferase/phosphomannomutase